MADSADTLLNVDDADLQQALTELHEAQRKVELLRRQNRGKVIAEICEKIRAYDLTAEELGFAASPLPRAQGTIATPEGKALDRAKDGRSVVQPKYIGPNGETWSGRGKDPGWLRGLIAQGRKREDFLVGSRAGEAEHKEAA